MSDAFEKRKELNKRVLRDIYLEVRHYQKHKVKDITKAVKGYIQTGIVCTDWTRECLSDILIKIEIKMRDIGQSGYFMDLYNKYRTENTYYYGRWAISNIITFLTCLAVDHTDVLEAIFNDYLTEV